MTGSTAPKVTVSVDPTAPGVAVPRTAIGLNTAIWDSNLMDARIPSLVRDAGVGILRYPGGSTSDAYHWRTHSMTANVSGDVAPNTTFDAFMTRLVQPAGARAMVTVNYGSNPEGTGGADPQEAASWVRYANVQHHYDVRYWEIGNEVYGNGYYGARWETDLHADRSPAAYARNAIAFSRAMKAQDPSIQVGLVLAAPTQWPDGQGPEDWNTTVLDGACSAADFVSVHWYPQEPGEENDARLLVSPSTIPTMVAKTRALLREHCGARGEQMEIFVTETNSVTSKPGKQTVGPVNALFLVEDFLTWLREGTRNVTWWTLHNSAERGNNTSAGLTGTATYGDYGVLARGDADLPADAPYPTYGALTLVGRAAQVGARFMQAVSSNPSVSAFALREPDGGTAVVVVNRDAAASWRMYVAGVHGGTSGARVWLLSPSTSGLTGPEAWTSGGTLPPYGAAFIEIPPTAL